MRLMHAKNPQNLFKKVIGIIRDQTALPKQGNTHTLLSNMALTLLNVPLNHRKFCFASYVHSEQYAENEKVPNCPCSARDRP